MTRLGKSITKYPARFFLSGSVLAPFFGGGAIGLIYAVSQWITQSSADTSVGAVLVGIIGFFLFFGFFGFVLGLVPGLMASLFLFLFRRKNLTMKKALPIVFVSTFLPMLTFAVLSNLGKADNDQMTQNVMLATVLGILGCIVASFVWWAWCRLGWAESND